MDTTSQAGKKTSFAQIKLIRVLTRELGLELAKKRENQIRQLSSTDASAIISDLQERLAKSGRMSGRKAVDDIASTRALMYLFEVRGKAKIATSDEERTRLLGASKAEVQVATRQAMRVLQDRNDAHGVPIPEWRLKRGLYTPLPKMTMEQIRATLPAR